MNILLISCTNYKIQTEHFICTKDTNSLDILINQFVYNIENIWGIHKILISGPKNYIKYTDQYQTRSHINFESGVVTIETITNDNPILHLRKAIIATLLMDENFKLNDLYSNVNKISTKKTPFLYGQVLDQQNQPIRWKWRAVYFTDFLLKTRLQTYNIDQYRKIWYITIQLIPNHIDERARKYLNIIYKIAQQYSIDYSLVLAIIQAESNFNPYAISDANAVGLMQIVQDRAGKDVFKMKGYWGYPSRSYLLNPNNNIDIGVAYLSILQNSYLVDITNPISRKYAVISAYNGGSSNVLRTFSPNPNQAFKIINNMQPDEVYYTLFTKHPSIESRYYLYKVNQLQQSYWCK